MKSFSTFHSLPRVFSLLAVGCVSLASGACSDGDSDGSDATSTSNGDAVGLDEFVEEYYDETACNGFMACGDPVEGRYRYESFKLCSGADELAGFSDADQELDELCPSGVDVAVEMDIDFEIEVQAGACSGGGTVDASIRIDVTDQCIRESGGPALRDACPQISDSLASVPEFSEGGCTVSGTKCTCRAELGTVAEGRCQDFVLESACVQGDTLQVSNVADSTEPAIWTFIRVDGASERRDVSSEVVSPTSEAATLPNGVQERLDEKLGRALPAFARSLELRR